MPGHVLCPLHAFQSNLPRKPWSRSLLVHFRRKPRLGDALGLVPSRRARTPALKQRPEYNSPSIIKYSQRPYNSPSIIKYSYDTSSVFGDRKLPDGRVGTFFTSEFHGHSQSTTLMQQTKSASVYRMPAMGRPRSSGLTEDAC